MPASTRTSATREALGLWTSCAGTRAELPRITGEFFTRYFKKAGRKLPWRKTRDPYRLLLAEVLLQKTHSRAVPAIWRESIKRWPSPKKLSRARLSTLEKTLRPLGLRKRAAWLRAIARKVADSGPAIFRDYESLRSLPGVGRYTANSVLCQAFGRRAPMADVNSVRVFTRLYGARVSTQRQGILFAEQALLAASEYAPVRAINLGVLDFASAVCQINPRCQECPMLRWCAYGSSLQSPPP